MASRLLSALRKGHDTLLEALQEVGGLEELPEEDPKDVSGKDGMGKKN